MADASYHCIIRDSANVVHVLSVDRYLDEDMAIPIAVNADTICYDLNVAPEAVAAMRTSSSTPITCLTCLVEYAWLDPAGVRLIANEQET